MAFICYLYQSGTSIPYMEAAPVFTLEAAKDFAEQMLRTHGDALKVEIFSDETHVARVMTASVDA